MTNNQDIQFVLCQTQCSSNIGSVARAISVMGFNQIILSSPQCSVDDDAYKLACHSRELLNQIRIVPNLSHCVEANSFVIGFSNRSRTKGPRFYKLHEGLSKSKERLKSGNSFRFVFGSENFGLSNEEVSFCDEIWEIPTFNPQYSSLNLAQAVQVVAYEVAQVLALQLAQEINKPVVPTLNENPLNFSGLDSVVNSLSASNLLREFMKKTTCLHTKNRLINIFKVGIKDESDLKFVLGFLKVFEKLAKKEMAHG